MWVGEVEDGYRGYIEESLSAVELALLNVDGRMRAGHLHASPPVRQTNGSQNCCASG